MGALTFSKIRSAAIDQDWLVERTAKGHHRLVPPDKSKDIVFTSGTPGDYRAVYNFLSQMRRSGFQWPPPRKQPNPAHPMILCADGGLASVEASLVGVGASTVRRNSVTSGIVGDAMFGNTRLDLKNNVEENVEETVWKDDGVTSVVEGVRSEQLNGHSLADPPERDLSAPGPDGVRWAALWIPDRFAEVQRYRISTDAQVVSESTGSTLKPALMGHQFYVSLTKADTRKTVSVRLDKLMLWTFVGEPKSDELEFPVHLNRDTADSSLDNLRWRLDTELPSDVPALPYGGKEPPESVRQYSKKKAAEKFVVKAPQEPAEPPVAASMTSDDDITVALTFSSCGVTLRYENNGWSINPCNDLSDDQVKAVGRMVQRWQGVHDTLHG